MSLIQTGQRWQFSSELDLEEVVWRNLPELLNVEPLRRQFAISGKFCDLLAIDASDQLVIIELKNSEDRYVVQQLTRYYDAIQSAEDLPFSVNSDQPRLIVIAPSFHNDTFIDCCYSTLDIELLTFGLEPLSDDINLTIQSISGTVLSTLCLPEILKSSPATIEISDPPRKLLNWLSHHSQAEYDWVMQMREQLLSFDPRMKEVVTPTSIFYGRGKSKACCEIKKANVIGYQGRAITCFLWLPHLQNKPRVLRMMVGFDLQAQHVTWLIYSQSSYRTGKMWNFPQCIALMKSVGWQRSLAHYQPLLDEDQTISSSGIVSLAMQTWHQRI